MSFTIATWNVLATAYIRPAFYPRTSPEFLNASWRVPALVSYARTLEADIICLQEVERAVIAALQEGLPGFEGTYAAKGLKRPDGCATFFRADRVTLMNIRRVEYDDRSGHIAQYMLFETEGHRLAVVNTHLKWDPPETPREKQWGYGQIRQALSLMTEPSDGQILCGDLNVTPEADVVQVLLESGFDYAHRNMPNMATCNSNRHAKLIDYLFSRGSLALEPVIPAAIDDETPLPSSAQPSDHVPLLARVEWK